MTLGDCQCGDCQKGEKSMTAKEQHLHAIFDVLVSEGGARESLRDEFIYVHWRAQPPCTEFRFGGHLGFGGKYLSPTNKATLYPEDETHKRLQCLQRINHALARVPTVFLEVELGGDALTFWKCAKCEHVLRHNEPAALPAWNYCPWCGTHLIKPPTE